MASEYHEGIGRRKTSTARVRVMLGTGTMTVNEKPLAEYFPRMGDADFILEPVREADLDGKLDCTVLVKGGGVSGQAGAVRHGLARALVKMDPDLRTPMSRNGYLTRDARMVERKKPGLKKARKAPTYTKR
ncbi:MAG TPA: 30S ribosomal protein S9 [Anaerolineales bacterium]|jgi:small subunit ribosomal protein S9